MDPLNSIFWRELFVSISETNNSRMSLFYPNSARFRPDRTNCCVIKRLRKMSAAIDSQSGLSSGEHVFGRLFLVGLVVAEHGPEHVDASSGEGEDGLGVPLALGSFAVVVGLRGWAVLDADHR